MTGPTGSAEVRVREIPTDWVDDLLAAEALPTSNAVVLLPDAINRGVAIFPADLVDTVKALKSDGVDASYLPAPKGRAFRSEYGADSALIVGLLVNIFSNGAYDAIKLTFQRIRQRLSARQAATGANTATLRLILTESPDGTKTLKHEIIGPVEAVLSHGEKISLQTLEKLLRTPIESDGKDSD